MAGSPQQTDGPASDAAGAAGRSQPFADGRWPDLLECGIRHEGRKPVVRCAGYERQECAGSDFSNLRTLVMLFDVTGPKLTFVMLATHVRRRYFANGRAGCVASYTLLGAEYGDYFT